MREYPKKPVAAVSGVLLDDERRVLLIRRAMPPARNLWSFPGGVIGLEESPEDALLREFAEETGIRVTAGALLEVSPLVIRDAEGRIQYNYILINYFVHIVSGTMRAGSDAAEAKWVHCAEIGRVKTASGVRSVLRKALRLMAKKDEEGKG